MSLGKGQQNEKPDFAQQKNQCLEYLGEEKENENEKEERRGAGIKKPGGYVRALVVGIVLFSGAQGCCTASS
jgi:hypothetical protein